MNEMIVSSVKGRVFDQEAFDPRFFESEELYLVELTPQKKSMKGPFERMLLFFSKGDHEVRKVIMKGDSGDKTTISFENKRANVPIPDERFEPGD